MAIRFLLALALALLPGTARAGDLDFSALRTLAVQRDGRKKPMDTVAIETIQKLTGKRYWIDPDTGRRMEPMDLLVSMWLVSRDWEKAPVILANYRPLRVKLGLPVDQKYFSYSQIVTPAFRKLLDEAAARERQKIDLTHDDREADTLSQRARMLAESIGPESLAIVPHPSLPRGAWMPITRIAESYGADREAKATALFQALGQAYRQRDASAFSAASAELAAFLRSLSPGVYPAATDLRREVYYNSFHPFRKAWMLYLLAFVWMLATWRVRGRLAYGVGVGLFLAGLVVHGWGFALRILISGRPPVTNMYESVVWVSFGAALFALILELVYRSRYYVVGVAPLSVVMLLLADQFPAVLNPNIGPLVPVLRDNFWLSIHVPTITLGYAAFAVALGVGHIALGYVIFAPAARETIRRLENLVYRAMQIGVLLLAAGTILGGIWAHYAWGRFWGWDPKETWALIALVCYLIPLHGRLAGWMSNFTLCAASVVCFLAVLMAWYGVNFVLGKGLHSYGFGVGGTGYVVGFVAVELAYVAFAVYRRKTTAPVRG